MTESTNPRSASVEEARVEIRNLLGEMTKLATADTPPEDFYRGILDRTVAALAAPAGAIWIGDGSGELELVYQVGLHKTELASREEYQASHAQLLKRSLGQSEGLLVPPHSGSDAEGGNPTELLLVLAPLSNDEGPCGLIEILQRPGSGASTQRGYLRFLLQACEIASKYFQHQSTRRLQDQQTLWRSFEQFVSGIHRDLDVTETAYAIANEGKRVIGCERLSVVLRRAGKCRMAAVSGQEKFEPRSNAVKHLEGLAKLAIESAEPIWYLGTDEDLPPQIQEVLHAYVDESDAQMIGVVPLFRDATESLDDVPLKDRDPRQVKRATAPFGALIVEQFASPHVSPGRRDTVEVVSRHSGRAIGNALEHDELFLMPLWRTLGKSSVVVQARHLPKTLAVLGVLLVMLLVLCLVPADFELEAEGVLQPSARQPVFAATEGTVDELLVTHGQEVKAGELLLTLRNPDLEVALVDVVGRLAASREQANSFNRSLLQDAELASAERTRLSGQLAQVQQTIKSLTLQHELLMKKKEALRVVSPIDGQVVTWDLERNLMTRPVDRGQILLTVADLDSPWELELKMPDTKIGPVSHAAEKMKNLPVTYLVATDPRATYPGTLQSIHASAEVRGDAGNTVLLRVALDRKIFPPSEELRPGASVTAKVNCGKRKLGYVWFYSAISFVQRKILFRL